MKRTNLIDFAIRRYQFLMNYLNDTADVTLANELRHEITNLLDTILFLDKKMKHTDYTLEKEQLSGDGDQLLSHVESELGSTSVMICLPQVQGEIAKHDGIGVQDFALRGSGTMLLVEEENDFRELTYTKTSLRAEK